VGYPTVTKVVEWVGGPYDGNRLELEDGFTLLSVAVESALSLTEHDDQTFAWYETVRVPIRLTPDGYRIYWHERR
jgi:hypothetical protein